MQNKTNLFVVGCPKAGTSSLYQYLKLHSDIFLPEQKELHYWSFGSLKERVAGPGDSVPLNSAVPSMVEYKEHFSSLGTEKVVGEVSPSYLFFYENIAQILKSYNDDAKIIILLRDPIDRAYSNYLHQKKHTYETLSFPDAIKAEKDRYKKGYSDFWCYTKHSMYYDACKKYIDIFGKDNVLIVVFEELKDNPNYVMKSIYSFLEIELMDLPVSNFRAHNKGGEYKKNIITDIFLRPTAFKSYLNRILPKILADMYKNAKRSVLNANEKETQAVDRETEIILKKKHSDDVKALAIDLGVNVSSWRKYYD